MKKVFLKLNLVIALLSLSWAGQACEFLFTGNVVQDYHSSGKVKTLKSISNIQDDFGDSSPIHNFLVKKSLFNKEKGESLKITINLKMKKGATRTESFKETAPWKEDSDYFSFSDFDAQKFSDSVYLNHVEQFEITLTKDKAVLCTKKVNVDNH